MFRRKNEDKGVRGILEEEGGNVIKLSEDIWCTFLVVPVLVLVPCLGFGLLMGWLTGDWRECLKVGVGVAFLFIVPILIFCLLDKEG